MSKKKLSIWYQELKSWKRMKAFIYVGIIGSIIDTMVLITLVGFGVLEELAVIAGIETSILFMFALNEYWTFKKDGDQNQTSLVKRLGRSHIVRIFGGIVQLIIFVFFYRYLFTSISTNNGINIWLLISKIAGILGGFLVNYIFESLYTWKVQNE